METNNDYQNRLPEHPEPLELGAHQETASPIPPKTAHHTYNRGATHKGSFIGWACLAVLAVGVLVGSIFWFSNREQRNERNMYASQMSQPGNIDEEEYDMVVYQVVQPTATKAQFAAKTKAAATATATAKAAATAAPQDVVYLFPLDGSEIPDDATLNKLAKDVAASGAYVSVVAYTDESGNSAYNQRLSERRAKRVGDYLISHGVPSNHVKTKGMGETHAYPTAAQDRRAEIHIN